MRRRSCGASGGWREGAGSCQCTVIVTLAIVVSTDGRCPPYAPLLSSAVYVPGTAYVCVRVKVRIVEIERSVWPSPKSRSMTPSRTPEPLPVNITSSGALPDVGDAAMMLESARAGMIIVTMPRTIPNLVAAVDKRNMRRRFLYPTTNGYLLIDGALEIRQFPCRRTARISQIPAAPSTHPKRRTTRNRTRRRSIAVGPALRRSR